MERRDHQHLRVAPALRAPSRTEYSPRLASLASPLSEGAFFQRTGQLGHARESRFGSHPEVRQGFAKGSEGLGSIRCQRIGTNGISRIQAIDIVSRAPGSTISDGIFHAVFHSPPEVPFRIQISETTPDGVVTWRDWKNPEN